MYRAKKADGVHAWLEHFAKETGCQDPLKQYDVYVGMVGITTDLYDMFKEDQEARGETGYAKPGTFARVFKER